MPTLLIQQRFLGISLLVVGVFILLFHTFFAPAPTVLAEVVTGDGVLEARASSVPKNLVLTLTDSTFEHDTQASSGMTTGDWLVLFYAPWCPHCHTVRNDWPSLAYELKGQVNVAWVDATVNSRLRERFNIHYYPEILFFHKQKMYIYNGDRTLEAFTNFALRRDGFDATTGAEIPPFKTVLSRLVDPVKRTIHQVKPQRLIILISCVTVGGVVVIALLSIVVRRICKDSRKPRSSFPQSSSDGTTSSSKKVT